MMLNCTLTPTEWNTNNCIQRRRIHEEYLKFGVDIPKFEVSGVECCIKDCQFYKLENEEDKDEQFE